jgi:hypothetical protein
MAGEVILRNKKKMTKLRFHLFLRKIHKKVLNL